MYMFNIEPVAEFFRPVAEKLCKGIRHQQQMAVGNTLAYVRCKHTTATDGTTRRQFNFWKNRQNGEWGTRQRGKGTWQGRRKAASKGRLLNLINLKLSLRRQKDAANVNPFEYG